MIKLIFKKRWYVQSKAKRGEGDCESAAIDCVITADGRLQQTKSSLLHFSSCQTSLCCEHLHFGRCSVIAWWAM